MSLTTSSLDETHNIGSKFLLTKERGLASHKSTRKKHLPQCTMADCSEDTHNNDNVKVPVPSSASSQNKFVCKSPNSVVLPLQHPKPAGKIVNPHRKKQPRPKFSQSKQSPPKLSPKPWKTKQCETLMLGMHCGCMCANLRQQCGSCDSPILPGDCIIRIGMMGWCHTLCDCDRKRNEGQYLFGRMVTLSPSARQNWENRHAARPKLLMDNTNHTHCGNFCNEENQPHCVVLSWEQKRKEKSQPAFGLTNEQLNVVQSLPKAGELIRVKARAGTGKTTTVSFLSHELLQRYEFAKILYVVFTANCCAEAKSSGKFPKNVCIVTSHSYAMHCLNMRNFSHFKSTHNKTKLIKFLNLKNWLVGKGVRNVSEVAIEKWCRRTIHQILKTLEAFQCSDSEIVTSVHVPWHMVGNSIVEGNTVVNIQSNDCVSWAQDVFDCVQRVCKHCFLGGEKNPTEPLFDDSADVDVTFDGCLKSCQLLLRKYPLPSDCCFDHVIVDECQDMNACQADLLWGRSDRQRANPSVHLVGDDRQRLYRFRGAGRHFENCQVGREFFLTGSFRFGASIANAATLVLQHDGCSTDHVTGLAATDGTIMEARSFERGVVICRTNNGIYKYLEMNRPRRWSLYSKAQGMVPKEYFNAMQELMRFANGHFDMFLHDGQEFKSLDELENYCTEMDNTAMTNKIKMIHRHLEKGTDITALFDELEANHVADWTQFCTSPDEFDGVLLLTCHRAKGLEFDNVCVTDDFRFESIVQLEKEDILAREHIQEMIDLVYVTFTRAKKNLYLFPGGMMYVSWLRAQHSTAKKPAHLPKFNGDTFPEKRLDFECQWQFFLFEKQQITSLEIVPFPEGPEDNPFFFDGSMSFEEQMRDCKIMLLRYHPDKFFGNFASRLPQDQKLLSELKEKLNRVTQNAMKFRNELRPMEQD